MNYHEKINHDRGVGSHSKPAKRNLGDFAAVFSVIAGNHLLLLNKIKTVNEAKKPIEPAT